jgi:hypothetical protein
MSEDRSKNDKDKADVKTDDETNQEAIYTSRLGWEVGTAFVLAGAVLSYAVQAHNWRLAQVASISGIVLLVIGLALLSKMMSSALVSERTQSRQTGLKERGGQNKSGEIRDKLLRRLAMVAGAGLSIIFLYSVQYRFWPDGRVLSTLSVGLVSAGAAWLTGVLLGFLFGIPHTKEGKPEALNPKAETGGVPTEDEDRYSQSTSLEQISDWLTKIIVGVGLTQLNNIPHKLNQLAEYVAAGLGGDKPNSAFALGIVLYFAVCGFLFGYLWGRLYMLGLFREADVKRMVEAQVEKFSAQLFDQRAKDLVERQLDPNDVEVESARLQDAILKASEDETKEIFELVREARKGDDASDETKRRAIPVLRTLIEADKDKLQHRYHSELAYIFRDRAKLEESLEEFATAIDIRNRRGKSGWKSYELEKAKAQIRLDSAAGPSAADLKEAVIKDLRAAWSDPKLQDRIRKPEITDWLKKNSMTIEAHISNP